MKYAEPLYTSAKKPMRVLAMVSEDTSLITKVLKRRETVTHSSFEVVGIYGDSQHLEIRPELFGDRDISVIMRDIHNFYSAQGVDSLNYFQNPGLRAKYDSFLAAQIQALDIDFLAFMGYPHFVTASGMLGRNGVNIHHGDLRVLDESGNRKYAGTRTGIGRMLHDGKTEVYSTARLIHPSKPDMGDILAMSCPVAIPDYTLNLDLQLESDVRSHSDSELTATLHSRLRENADADLVIHTLDLIARRKFMQKDGKLLFEGCEIPDGIDITQYSG